MDSELIKSIIRLSLFLIVIVIGIIIIIKMRRRYVKTSESANLATLKCKKEEINAIMNRLTNYASYPKDKIKILWENGIIDDELNQLRVVLAQYNEIKKTLTTEQLQHEREDYNNAVRNITTLFSGLKEKSTEEK